VFTAANRSVLFPRTCRRLDCKVIGLVFGTAIGLVIGRAIVLVIGMVIDLVVLVVGLVCLVIGLVIGWLMEKRWWPTCPNWCQ